MFTPSFALFVCILAASYPSFSNAGLTGEAKLHKALLTNYIRTVIPVANHSHPLTLSISLVVNHVDIDDLDSKAIVHGILKLSWEDAKLKWNDSDFDHIHQTSVTTDDVWVPDISLYNNRNGVLLDFKHKGQLTVKSNGHVSWEPHLKIETPCPMQLKYWPYDTQVCDVVFGSWVHSGHVLNLHLENSRPQLDLLSKNLNWKIVATHSSVKETVYNCCPEPYQSILFQFDFERQSPMLAVLLIVPMVSIVMMLLAAFWITPNRGEKILLNGINFLLCTECILSTVKKLPNYSKETPIITIIQMTTFALLTVSMILSVVLMKLTKDFARNRRLNQRLLGFLQNGALNRICCLPYLEPDDVQKNQTELKDHFEEGKSADDNLLIGKKRDQEAMSSHDVENNGGIILAIFIDRIFFYVYVVIYFVLLLKCFV